MEFYETNTVECRNENRKVRGKYEVEQQNEVTGL